MTKLIESRIIAVERFISAAFAFTGFKETPVNGGQVVARFLKGTGLPEGYAWCAAFIHHIGF